MDTAASFGVCAGARSPEGEYCGAAIAFGGGEMSWKGGRGSCCGGGIRAGVTDCGVIGRKLEAFTESDWRLEVRVGEGIATGGGWREGGF